MEKKILFIEDDRFIRDLVTEKLESKGYSVVVAVSAEAAFFEIENHQFDIILLDLELPTLHGQELLKELRKKRQFRALPVIIYSNNDDPEMKEVCKKLGVEHFFVKANTDLNSLMETIRSVLA